MRPTGNRGEGSAIYIYDCKGNEHDQGDYLLQDLELPQGEGGIAYTVRRNLKQIFEESYSPAHERRDVPRAMREIPQMGVPGERHKNIREQQQTSGAKEEQRSDSSSCVDR